MHYPKFLKENDTIGITALSSGVGHKIDSFNESVQYIESQGFHVIETENVRKDAEPSSPALDRAEQFHQVLTNPDISAIFCAAGGDFQIETMPYIDFDEIKKHPKWILGASDPTNLLFPMTCACDIATIYGFNGGSFDEYGINTYSKQLFSFLKGENQPLQSSKMHQNLDYFNDGKPVLNTETKYTGEIDCTGRLLGGCFESINDLAGTPYDHVNEFIGRYKEDGILWFFDVFSMNSCDLYRALLKMKSLGYFEYTKAIFVGRVLFENVSELITYQEAFHRACPDLPIIMESDIGHTYPHLYLINGAFAHIQAQDGKGSFEYILK